MPVRRATAADVDLVAPLFDAYRVFYHLPSDLARARTFLAERLTHGESVVFLATSDRGGEPVGFVQLYPLFSSLSMARLWILNDLFVRPDARGGGAARALMKTARAHAEATGACGLELQTAKDNRPARTLYESLGWELDTQLDAYRMALTRAV